MKTRSSWAWALCGMGALAWVLPAHAEVRLPDGTSVPRVSNNGETQLSTLFANRGEAINFIADGFPEPDTFSPLCDFKATFVLKQGESVLGLGWYNADPNATTPPSAVYTIVPPGTPVGTVISGADIRSSPNYAGGLIGFALIRTPFHYSEARWNTVCTSCTTPGPWILSVSYRSTVLPNAYYLAFEDGDTTSSGWNNDGDYNDYVFLFEGLACAGDGQPCEVPDAKGVCKDGLKECDNLGTLTCKPITPASDERCDGLDNDCDGEVDDGELCEADEVCSRGVCVLRCSDAEFPCTRSPYFACEDGLCVEPECVGKRCGEGQFCVAGECRGSCEGVTCPTGQACRFGVCLDPCEGVTCAEPRVCVGGACVLGCECAGCASGNTCASNGLCIDSDCIGKSCGAGEYCAANGVCSDACQNASCPTGAMCEVGECVPSPVRPEPDAGAGDGTSDDGPGQDGTSADGTDAPADAGTSETVDPSTGSGSVSVESNDSGCGCRVPGAPSRRGAIATLWLALALLGLVIHRRSR